MRRSYKISLILSALYTLISNVSAADVSVSINQSQKEEKLDTKKAKVSYYTVKDFESFRYTVETAKSGSVIILVGSDINSEYTDLIIKNKELTIVSNNCSRRIKFKNIKVENGTLNLGIPGTKSPSELHVTSRFTLNNSSLNLYDGAYIDGYDKREGEYKEVAKDAYGRPKYDYVKVPKFNGEYLIDACNTDTKINLYGGEIKNNYFCGLIDGGAKSTLIVDGTKIIGNHFYGDKEPSLIKDFIFKTGLVNTFSISSENATVLGGEFSNEIKTSCATISGNPSITKLTCNSVSISGNPSINRLDCNNSASISGGIFGCINPCGKRICDIEITGGSFGSIYSKNLLVSGTVNIGNLYSDKIAVVNKLDNDNLITVNKIDAKNVSISGKVTIKELVSDTITVDGKLDDSSSINVSLKDYTINNKKKVFDVNNGVEVRDVFHNFKLARANYFVNNKGYLDDTPSYKYELIDDSTGIKIESDINITHVKRGEESKATFTICQPSDTDKENVYHLNFYINDKFMEFSDVTNMAIYVPYVASKLDLNKLNSIKIYDTNNEEITNCSKTIKSVNGNLYYLITTKK